MHSEADMAGDTFWAGIIGAVGAYIVLQQAFSMLWHAVSHIASCLQCDSSSNVGLTQMQVMMCTPNAAGHIHVSAKFAAICKIDAANVLWLLC